MKIQAILVMCNDFNRLDYTLKYFTKYNPDIPVLVVNSGGNPPNEITDKYSSVSLKNAPNLWHTEIPNGGSFGPQFADYFFEYGLNENFTHTLLLETDVKTNGKIIHEPLYDVSGPIGGNGWAEDFLYDYLNIEPNPKLHSACGGTIFSLNYFKTIKEKDFSFFQTMFEKFPKNYFTDMMLTLVARKNGLTFGDWDAVSNHEYTYKKIQDKYYRVPCNYKATMVHNIKV